MQEELPTGLFINDLGHRSSMQGLLAVVWVEPVLSKGMIPREGHILEAQMAGILVS